MTDENPDSGPPTATTIAQPPNQPQLLSGVLLFFGSCFLLVLNGQAFTNRIVFLASVASSGLLWIRYRRRSKSADAGQLALLVHVLLFVFFAASLPEAYSHQIKFNKAVDRVRLQSQASTR